MSEQGREEGFEVNIDPQVIHSGKLNCDVIRCPDCGATQFSLIVKDTQDGDNPYEFSDIYCSQCKQTFDNDVIWFDLNGDVEDLEVIH